MLSSSPETPMPPASQETLANLPTGTTLTSAPGQGSVASTGNLSVLVDGSSDQILIPTPIAASTTSYTKTAAGFDLSLPQGLVAHFNTGAGSSDVILPNHYVAALGSNPWHATASSNAFVDVLLANPLKYSNYGIWLGGEGTKANILDTTGFASVAGVFAYGVGTQLLPATGSATYQGTFQGFVFNVRYSGSYRITGGIVNLSTNFGLGSVVGSVSNMTVTNYGEGTVSSLPVIALNGMIDGAGFSGTATTAGQYGTGAFGGKFYGPNGAEMAGSVSLPGSTDPGSIRLGGQYNELFGAFSASISPPLSEPQYTLATLPIGTTLTAAENQGAIAFVIPQQAGIAHQQVFYTKTTAGFDLALPGGDSQFGGSTLPGGVVAHFNSGPVASAAGFNHYVTSSTSSVDSVRNSHAEVILATGLTYSTYGAWAISDQNINATSTAIGPASTVAGVLAYGVATTPQQMPTTGTAAYQGNVQGFYFLPSPTGPVGGPIITYGQITGGNVSLTTNFASNAISGAVTNMTTVTFMGDQSLHGMNDLALNGTISGPTFTGAVTVGPAQSGRLDIGGTPDRAPFCCTAGSFAGKFYGPGAAEAAGSFNVGDASGIRVFGAFGATK